MVTHDHLLASQMDRVLTLVDGVIVSGVASELADGDKRGFESGAAWANRI